MKIDVKQVFQENSKLKEQMAEIQKELCQVHKDYAYLVHRYNDLAQENIELKAKLKLKIAVADKKVNSFTHE